MKKKNPEKEETFPEDLSDVDNIDIAIEEEGIELNQEDVDNIVQIPLNISSASGEEDDSSDSDSSDSDSSDDEDDVKIEVAEGIELDEEDPVVKAIAAAQEKKKSDHPADLKLDAMPTAICFHSQNDLIVTGTYEGEVELHSYSDEENKRITISKHENEIVREICFNSDGDKLYAAFTNQDFIIYDVKEGLKPERTIQNASPSSVSSIYAIDENTFATGDDDGYVMIWDKRSKSSAITLKIGDDAVTSMITNNEKRILICASAEGSIYALKIRGGGKVQTESEIYDHEFNCLGLFKQESKLAVGSGNGDVFVFNWNEFGKHSDIYTGIGKGEPINSIIPITERIIVSGGDDGYIRAVNFFPQKFLGVVGKVPYPIDKMDVCNDGHLIASIGAEKCVKFWNVSYFENMTVSTEEKNKNVRGKSKPMKDELNKANLPSSSHQNSSDFYKGLE